MADLEKEPVYVRSNFVLSEALIDGYETSIGSSRGDGNVGRWRLSGSTERGGRCSADARALFHTGYSGPQSAGRRRLLPTLAASGADRQAEPHEHGVY